MSSFLEIHQTDIPTIPASQSALKQRIETLEATLRAQQFQTESLSKQLRTANRNWQIQCDMVKRQNAQIKKQQQVINGRTARLSKACLILSRVVDLLSGLIHRPLKSASEMSPAELDHFMSQRVGALSLPLQMQELLDEHEKQNAVERELLLSGKPIRAL